MSLDSTTSSTTTDPLGRRPSSAALTPPDVDAVLRTTTTTPSTAPTTPPASPPPHDLPYCSSPQPASAAELPAETEYPPPRRDENDDDDEEDNAPGPSSSSAAFPSERVAGSSKEKRKGGGEGAEGEQVRDKRVRKTRHKRRPSSQHRVKETMDAIASEGEDGRRTVNQYRLGPVLGQGAYGTVELGVDVQTGLTFAVKEYSKSRLRKQIMERSVRERRSAAARGDRGGVGLAPPPTPRWMGEDNPLTFISREVAIMKKLDHPNLIHLYEVLDVPLSDGLFMVLEYCPGGTLLDMPCRSKPPLKPEQSKHYFSQLILGLEYLHSNGVIHRDIKPENILLSMDGQTAKFCDFGVSDMFNKSGDAHINKANGSPAFMPPECTTSGEVHLPNAIDIWSLGVTLYVMLTGDLPFIADNPIDLFDSIRDDPVSIPAEWPEAQKDIIRRMLVKDAEARITIDEIRAHPYLQGIDLPSKDVNLADERMVGEPSPEELRGAIRSISSAFAVIRAVQKFRKLTQKNRRPTPSPSSTALSFTSDSSLAPLSAMSSPQVSTGPLPSSSVDVRPPIGRQSTGASSLQVPDFCDEPEEMDEVVESGEPDADGYRSRPGSFLTDEPEDIGGEAPTAYTSIGLEVSDEPESLDLGETDDIATRLHSSTVRDATPVPERRPTRPSPLSRQSSGTFDQTATPIFTSPPKEVDEPAGLESQESVKTIRPDRPAVAVDTSSLAPPASPFGIIVESPGGGREELN